jgi:hypothetical protein
MDYFHVHPQKKWICQKYILRSKHVSTFLYVRTKGGHKTLFPTKYLFTKEHYCVS